MVRCRTAEMIADRQPEEEPDDHAADRERDRRGQVLADLVEHVDVRDVAAAEVLVGEHVPDVASELLVLRTVEAEVGPDRLDHLGRRLTAGAERGGVRRREDVEHDEGDRADEDQQQHHPGETSCDVAGHVWLGGGEGARAGPPRERRAGRPDGSVRNFLLHRGEGPVPGGAVVGSARRACSARWPQPGSPTCTGSSEPAR